ncbi:uncharacterized protein LOC105834974 [Monomorium pharaonis]|uniref:uncharacterized protein LOC105834974 n=1 Tax=Monomorium pharaonis TaxID=307658 RepID=UPI00063F48DE|nr:uncharacterized protein LOC105834974 [Monomorium pharaonis]
MSPRDLVFRFLLFCSVVYFSTTSIIRPQKLFVVRLSPESPARNLGNVPGRWRTVQPEFKAPQIEIRLMKNHISPDWNFINEYKYSGKDYHGAPKMTSATNERKVSRIRNGDMKVREKEKENPDNILMPDGIIPQIGSRNIIAVPTYCPEGQREDSRGRCRTVIT